jgi:acyl phosphate:glycerol-3-phosphate acyltransferase
MQYLALVACYLLGAIPFGVIIGKITRGIDIRDYGSGNIGFSNVLRTLGPGPGLAVFFFDTAKGFAAVVLCERLKMSEQLVVTGGILSIVGHSFSIFLRFQGGKGVATSLGMITGLNPLIAGIAFVMWLTLVALTRIISIASIVSAISVPTMMFLWKSQHVPFPYQVVAVMATALIVVKHRSNIRRLMNGTESKVGQRVKIEPKEGEDG